ncbi:pilus assembly protein TadG-related protein [Streptomyces sp. NPDC047002]|uniref:pilus assembly protein TadG-related protein n=1 Tax=Streptomyces sp. NPDC047002 TaxID=3155475 RepID=UPI00345164AD
MTSRGPESGQAAALYIVMIAGVLFAALAFFVVGQAGATRNGAQSAADAAALAAGQQSRDDFKDHLLDAALDPGFLAGVFAGAEAGPAGGACAAAGTFANANRAAVTGCSALGDRWGFTVGVVSQNTVGRSVVPGTENDRATATATAVVEPRCSFSPAASTPPQSPPPASGGGPQSPTPVSPGSLACPGTGDITIDPKHLDRLPDMADLFTVRLVDN